MFLGKIQKKVFPNITFERKEIFEKGKLFTTKGKKMRFERGVPNKNEQSMKKEFPKLGTNRILRYKQDFDEGFQTQIKLNVSFEDMISKIEGNQI